MKFSFIHAKRFRVDNSRVFQQVYITVNMTVGQAACWLLYRYMYLRHVGCVRRLMNRVDCDVWISRTVARKFSIGEFYVCSGGLGILEFDKNSTDLQCFIIQFGGLGALFAGAKPPKASPWRRDCESGERTCGCSGWKCTWSKLKLVLQR